MLRKQYRKFFSYSRNLHTDAIDETVPFPFLFKPLELRGGIVLKNRSLMGSMHTGMEESSSIFDHSLDELASFYAERAKGNVGLIVTGGIAPNNEGRVYFGSAMMSTSHDAEKHKIVTESVHEHGGKIAMQILHAGRYGYHFWPVSASAIKSPISPYKPSALSRNDIYRTIDDFVNAAVLSRKAGYDGVEVMGSEGYLINQFLVSKTNKRNDEFGGSYENRMRLPIQIVKRIREAVGEDFIIIYRLSMLDLVKDGSSWEEIVELSHRIESAGASIINTGIGWHEARIPTIATSVPRGAFSWVTKKLKAHVNIPLCTTNRINSPEIAEDILSSFSADMVSMARPFLADPYFMVKAKKKELVDQINTCIGCNQACLDHTFSGKRASCLVNPRAGYESKLIIQPVMNSSKQRIAVIGGGPAGLAFSVTAASRGHLVTLFEKEDQIGGQFNMAKLIPGKNEFFETIRYFQNQLKIQGVDVRLKTEAALDMLQEFDAIVVATGVVPRQVSILNKCVNRKINVYSYIDVLKSRVQVGDKVAVIGAGGIGFDVAEFLSHYKGNANLHVNSPALKIDEVSVNNFLTEWGIDKNIMNGGIIESSAKMENKRKIYLLQRKSGKLGNNLGKTTGWIHRLSLDKQNVEKISGCKYLELNDDGFLIQQNETQRILDVDTIVMCAGQEPLNELYENLKNIHKKVFVIGGAFAAAELDAKRAIDQGTRLAAVIENAKSGEIFDAPPSLSMMGILQKYVLKS